MTNGAMVFVVDDDPATREAVAATARSRGLRTEAFTSVGEFLKAPDDQPGCLVADVRLRGPDGADVQDALARQGRELPLVGLVSRPDTETVVAAMRRGAVTVLDKPVNGELLKEALRSALAIDAMHRQQREELRDVRQRFHALTDKEREVLRMMVAGKPNKAMANAMGASLRTIENRRREVFSKLGVRSVAELVALALKAKQDNLL